MKQKVYLALKPKVSAFGFDKNEVMGIAADIANNLNLKEEATDEEINESIESSINAVLPYLKYGQSQANRVINDWKKSNEKKAVETENEGEKKEADNKSDDMKSLMTLLQSMQEKLNNLEAEKTTSSRRSKLENMLKDAGTFGQSKLRDFSRMKFEKDEDFDAFCDEIENDLKSLVQESADNGLSKLSPPQGAKGKKEDVMSDEEIDRMADGM